MEKKYKRNILSLRYKAKIIAEVDNNPHLAKIRLARRFKIPVGTVFTILKNRVSILKTIAKCGELGYKRKNARHSPKEYLEEKLLDWLIDRQEKGFPISPVLARQQATVMAADLGLEKFTASSGWIDSFKHRHGLPRKLFFHESVAACKKRWAAIRDKFPERTEPFRKKRKKNGEGSYSQSIFVSEKEKLLGNTSAETISSHLMPLENASWSETYPNFPDQRTGPESDPSIHFPEIKLEVDSFDEEDKQQSYEEPSHSDKCDFNYIVPHSPFQVAIEEKSAVSLKRTHSESEIVNNNCNHESFTEPQIVAVTEIENKAAEHPIETFFKSMSATVLTFPPHLMAVAKLNVCKLITELELRALAEKNAFDGNQERVNEMLTENIVKI